MQVSDTLHEKITSKGNEIIMSTDFPVHFSSTSFFLFFFSQPTLLCNKLSISSLPHPFMFSDTFHKLLLDYTRNATLHYR